MQPYQEAGQEIQRQSQAPGKIIGGVLSKIIPFLNTTLPASLAIKGITRIAPHFKKFFDAAMKTGKSEEESINFVREQVTPKESGRREALGKFNKKIKQPGVVEQEAQRFNAGYGQEQQPQQTAQPSQQGSGDEALMAALQKILSM